MLLSFAPERNDLDDGGATISSSQLLIAHDREPIIIFPSGDAPLLLSREQSSRLC